MKKFQANNFNNPSEMTHKLDPGNLRVIQIHPSLRCNLTCKHCYSSSGPAFKDFTGLDDLVSFLKYARSYGFDVTSVSGGEPFMYPKLEELLEYSHSLGNRNIAASNGMLLQGAKAKSILKHLDLIAISIDGKPDFHDEIRNLKGAFNKMEKGVEVLKDLGKTFGFIHTITEESWQNFIWLADYAYEKGASLVQLHPLELTGRALKEFNHLVPSEESLHKIFILGNFLQEKFQGEMKVHLDFLHREYIVNSPLSVSYHGEDFELTPANFSDAVKCLIIDEKGDIYPMSYGFNPYFCLGNIKEIKEGRDIFMDFINLKGKALYKLISNVFEDIAKEREVDLITWTELIVKESHAVEYAEESMYS